MMDENYPKGEIRGETIDIGMVLTLQHRESSAGHAQPSSSQHVISLLSALHISPEERLTALTGGLGKMTGFGQERKL